MTVLIAPASAARPSEREVGIFDIERALAKVQARLGLIPQEACDEIVSHCELAQIDMARSEHVRRIWPFLRDRRIDAYGDITKRYID